MVQKRPFGDDKLYDLSCKHPRQLECSNQLPPFLEIVSHQDAFLKPLISDADFKNNVLGCFSMSSWPISCNSEEDPKSEDAFLSNSDQHPQKPIPIGPDHQADIVELEEQSKRVSPNYSDPYVSENLILLSSQLEHNNGDKVGEGRADCSCQDQGSIRCVRQHITEARKKLKINLGQERFRELGFCDMGEEVADKWCEEEEQLFHEVVFSNPASLGKNFWEYLQVAFPLRAKREIVSYYFNVFMLRRRAEQNRCYPMNIDSDDDEWLGNDVDDDSVSESPVYEDGYSHIQSPVYEDDHCHDRNPEDSVDERDVDDGNDEDDDGTFDDISGNGNFGNTSKLCHEKIKFENDSGTSSDTGGGSQESQDKGESNFKLNGLNNSNGGHQYAMDNNCDSRVWDIGYFTFPKNEVDFLPTCSMIEEVFGDGAWSYKPRDGKGMS